MSGTLRLRGATSGYSELQAPAVAADQTFILPTAGGTLLTTDSPVPKLTLELGSASQPSLTFEGDTDTGLYSSGTNTLNLVTGGTTHLTIDATGSVTLSSSLTSGSGSVAAQQFIVNTAGSAASPAYRFGLGSGFFAPSGTDHVAISTASTERLVVDGSGNVGINSTSPSYRLQLGNNTTNATATPEVLSLGGTYSDTAGSNPKLRLWDDNTNYMGIGVSSSKIDYICAGTFDHVFYTNSAERMRINSAGSVGIGTASPTPVLPSASSLTISNAAGHAELNFLSSSANFSSLYFGDSTSGVQRYAGYLEYSHPNDFMRFGTGTVERLRLDNLGNVGIGTSTPNNYAGFKTLTINGSSGGALEFVTNGTADGIIYGSGVNQTFLIQARASRHLTLHANDVEVMRLTTNGNVGIGTTTPYVTAWGVNARQLHISGPDYGVSHLTSTSYGPTTWSHGAGGSARSNYLAYDGSNHWLTITHGSGGVLMPGVYNIATSSAANVYVTSTGQLYRSTSSIKYKTDVETLEDQYADAILKCRPVWYRSVCDGDIIDKSRNKSEFGYYGFIAEEVADIDPRLVSWKTKKDVKNDDNWEVTPVDLDPAEYEAEGVNYTNFVPLLLNLLKRQKTELETLKEKVAALENV